MARKYQICTRCIMDTSDPEIEFDKDGICSHCKRYDELLPKRVFHRAEGKRRLSTLISEIRKTGVGSAYDCIIGVSGGVDSTYVAYLSRQLGLRPLAVHFDNGWNSSLAVNNVERTLKKLDIDLYTYVINWEDFKDLQISFLKASTPDGEIPSDHAINALLFMEASKRGIRYIINGMNFATESMAVKSWAYGHSDWKYIQSVHRLFCKSVLKEYPYYNFFHLFWWTFIKKIKVVSILNYVPYNNKEVMDVLQKELDWVYYGGKHYESVYTRFYQGYILPQKFNIDKRKGHLSDLIHAGQLTREEALSELRKPIYDPQLLIQDREYVIKKLSLTEDSFDKIMALPIKSYRDYPNREWQVSLLKQFVNYLRFRGLYSK
jgi:N-acetyl sugar amidotransferase